MSRAAEIAVLLIALERERGKAPRITSTDPRVIAWAAKGVTDTQLREAYTLAVADRVAKQDPAPLNAGYLEVFIDKVLNPPKVESRLNGAPAKPGEWWQTPEGIFAKAESQGVEVAMRDGPDGEMRDSLVTLARLCAKLGPGKWFDERNATLVRLVESARQETA